MFNINNTADQEFTDAVNHCLDLLRQNNYISDINNDVISRRSAVLGQNIYEYLKQFQYGWSNSDNKPEKVMECLQIESSGHMISDKYTIKQEPLEIIHITMGTEQPKNDREKNSSDLNGFHNQLDKYPVILNNVAEKEIFIEKSTELSSQPLELIRHPNIHLSITENPLNTTPRVSPKPTERIRHPMPLRNSSKGSKDLTKTNDNNNNNENLLNETQKRTWKKRIASLEEKKKVVELAQANPTWSVKLLQQHGSPKLLNLAQLRTWEKQLRRGGSIQDNFRMVDRWTYSNYLEAIKKRQQVSRRMLQEWAIQAGTLFLDSKSKQMFKASKAWIAKFVKRYNIQIDNKTK